MSLQAGGGNGRRRMLGWLVSAPCLLAGCDGAQDSSASRGVLRIGIDLWSGYYPLLLAQELGYLARAGLSVDISIPQNTHKLMSDFVAGTHDAVCASLGDIIVLTRETNALRMVLASDESAGGDVLLAVRPVRGAEDLKGRRFGVSLGGFGELLALRYLARFGLSLGDVELINVDASEVPARLSEGALDIGHSWEPYASAGRQNGLLAVFSSLDTPGLIPDGLIVNADVLHRRRADFRALIAAWFEAQAWWQTNTAQGREILLRLLAGKTSDVSLGGVRLLDRAANLQRFVRGNTDTSLHHVASQYIEHFVARGVLVRRPSVDDLLDGSLL